MHRLQKSICMGVVVMLVTVVTAEAYVPYAKWNAQEVCYQFSASLPAAFKTPTNNAASGWSGAGGANFRFARCSEGHVWAYGHVDGFEGPILAATTLTWYWDGTTRIMVDADTTYDHDEHWWTSTGSPVPGDKIDAWSVAAHEFGHWLSLDHSCTSPDGKIPTMCSPIPYGTWWARTLAQDDIDGIKYLYPAQ